MLACTNCASPIQHDASAGRLPPWCPHCGAGLRFDDAKPTATATLPEGRADTPPQPPATPPTVSAMATFETVAPPFETPLPRTYGILLKASIVLLGLTAFLGYRATTDADDFSRATGTVVDVQSGSGGGTRPEVAYEVADTKYTITGQESGWFVKAHAAGESVQVLYTPLHPEDGHLYCPEDEWLWVDLVGAAGLALLVSWWVLRRRARRLQLSGAYC